MLVFNAKPDALLEKLLPNYNPLQKNAHDTWILKESAKINFHIIFLTSMKINPCETQNFWGYASSAKLSSLKDFFN